MASQWLQGRIKEVPSGDTIVVSGGRGPNGMPVEKKITLAFLIAPRMGRRDGTTSGEDFCWESREFLRQKCIGKACVFRFDYMLDQLQDRVFGSVVVDKENLGMAVAKGGWAKVRATVPKEGAKVLIGGNEVDAMRDALEKASESAKSSGVGIFNNDPDAKSQCVRLAGPDPENKGTPVKVMVDHVLNGSAMRVVTADHQQLTVSLAGCAAPAMRGEQPAEGAAEAKFFAEMKVLNRDVKMVPEGADQNGRLVASVLYEEGDAEVSLTEQLLQQGLAKYVEWSANMTAGGGRQLKGMELSAKQRKINMWRNYTPPVSNTTKLSDKFTGKVVEAVSGDTLSIKDLAAGVERRLSLASIRAPRLRTPDGGAPEAYAHEAREVLRRRLVGREVEVSMEYTKKIPAGAGQNAQELVVPFCNVTWREKEKEKESAGGAADTVERSAAELMVARGLATIVKHREGDDVSSIYDRLLDAEAAARSKKLGMHSGKEPPVQGRFNDLSAPGSGKAAKQHLPHLQRAGEVNGVCEHVMSGHRLKIHIPKEGVVVAFSPSGVRAPQRSQPARGASPASKGEPCGDEAYAFVREHCMQRNVTVRIESVDRIGTFNGQVRVQAPGGAKTLDLAAMLLEAGLGQLMLPADRVTGGEALAAAQQRAKSAGAGLWAHYTEPEAGAAGAEAEAEASSSGGAAPGGKKKVAEVSVTEVQDAGHFFVQIQDQASSARLSWLEGQIKEQVDDVASRLDAPLRSGSRCLAQFTLDDQWYRAYVERVRGTGKAAVYDVFFMDYGNRESLSVDRIRKIEHTCAAVQPLAHLYSLAHLRVPDPADELGMEAKYELSALVGEGRKLQATIETVERAGKALHPSHANGHSFVTLTEGEDKLSINAQLVSTGLARLPARRKLKAAAAREAVEALQQYEDEAREAHLGLFMHGDPGDSEDEDDYPALGRRR